MVVFTRSQAKCGKTLRKRKDVTKDDYLRSLGIGLLRIPNGLVLEDPEEFVRKVREAIGVTMGQVGPR
jgi:very-short-patch-repair endonuclease